MLFAWRDGEFIPRPELTFDGDMHGMHYAGSVLEGECAYPQLDQNDHPTGRWHIVMAHRHGQRLMNGAATLAHRVLFSQDEVTRAAALLAALNRQPNSSRLYIRRLVSRKEGLGVDPSDRSSVISIRAKEWGAYLKRDVDEHGGVSGFVTSRKRLLPEQLPGSVKSAGHYELGQLMDVEANQVGASLGISSNYRDELLDTSGSNIQAIRRDGAIVYPDNQTENILPGLTQILHREVLFARLGLYYDRSSIRVEDFIGEKPLYVAAFLLGTTVEVTPWCRLFYRDKRGELQRVPIGNGRPHPTVLKIKAEYDRFKHGQIPEMSGPEFLTPVPSESDKRVIEIRRKVAGLGVYS